jgi:hypothetical protein
MVLKPKNMKSKILYALLVVALPVGLYAQTKDAQLKEAPRLFQVTTAETRPGDAVLVRGEYLDRIKAIKVSRLVDASVDEVLPAYLPLPKEDALWEMGGTDRKAPGVMEGSIVTVDRLQQNQQSVKFVVPAGWQEGVYSVRLIGRDGATDFYVNVPKVSWAISEQGLKAVAGDHLRVMGKNLVRKGLTGQAVLIGEDGKKVVRVKVTKVYDDYCVSVDIPAGTPTGNYQLYYHNGQGGRTAWSEPLKIAVVAPQQEKWEARTFNVKNFGGKGDGVHNETDAFRAALDAAGRSGGGTVIVPRGRYMLTGELIIPPFTMLKGESVELAQLFWNPLNWDTREMPRSLITGTHHFGVKDLNIWASRAWGVIVLTGPVEEQGHVTLENLIVRQSGLISGMLYQVKANRDTVESEFNSKWIQTGLILRGEELKVRNCDFNLAGMYTFFAASGFIQHCKFRREGTGINQPYMLVHPKGLIFEDCYKQADGYGYAATIDESHDMYEARNVIPYNYANDRECMTLDGGSGGYAGPIGNIREKVLTLPKGAKTNRWTPGKWKGGGLFIVEGRGAGQYRRITNCTMDMIELDQPFLVDPDSSSVISVTTVRKNLYFIDNDITDAGAYQFYGSAQNCVISGLKMRRSNGIVCRGSLLYTGKQPNWYIDVVNCELRECNYSHWFGTEDRGHSGFTNINLIGAGGAGLNIGTLLRRNRLSEYAYMRTSPGANANAVTDVIIEDNSFHIAKLAIQLGGTGSQTSYTLIHRNHYTEVDKQVEAEGLKPSSYLILDDGK